MSSYRSQIRQSLHYFARPHSNICRAPIVSPATWRGSDYADPSAYRDTLTPQEINEILAAVDRARALGKPMGALRRSDFPLPKLAPKLDRWRRELRTGRGFQVISGVPVWELGQTGSELFFWCFGLHLGIPGAQNPQGDLLGHVRDDGAPADGSVRQYRTTEGIDYHCDLADVVGLLCLTTAKRGGRSRIASSITAYNELLSRRPELADRLYKPILMDTKGEGGVRWIGVVPCAHANGELRTFWHIGYFRSVGRLPFAPPLDRAAEEVLDLYDAIMNEPDMALEMDLAPGDIQLLSNHVIVHGRTAFEDHEAPAQKRHLLRLWLSLPERRSLALRMLTERSRAEVLGRLLIGRARARLG